MKIEKCPICGCPAVIPQKMYIGFRYYCECADCGFVGKPVKFKHGAIKAWNKEAEQLKIELNEEI